MMGFQVLENTLEGSTAGDNKAFACPRVAAVWW
jgi:hypothetical protein